MCTGISLYLIERLIPNHRKNHADDQEDKSCHKDTSVITLFHFTKLTFPVISILLMLFSAHRDKGKNRIPQNEADADERTFAADIHHASKRRHQDTRYEERIRQDLDIDRQAVCEEAPGPNHQKTNQRFNGYANRIIS